MRYIFGIYPYIALSALLTSFFLIRSLIAFKRRTSCADGKHAVARLRNLPRGEHLIAQPVVGVPLHASDTVQASEHLPETLATKPFLSTETSPPVSIDVQPPAELIQCKPPPNPNLSFPANTTIELTLVSEKLPKTRQTESPKLPMPIGSKVWTICKLGSVTQGAPGIITGKAEARFFWQSSKYQCTFANNMTVLAGPKDIELYNHGHSLEDLKQADLNSILSKRMTLRAQQLGHWQRSAHRPFVGPTKVSNEIAE